MFLGGKNVWISDFGRKISLNFGKDLFLSGTFFRASFLGTVLFLVNENMVPLLIADIQGIIYFTITFPPLIISQNKIYYTVKQSTTSFPLYMI